MNTYVIRNFELSGLEGFEGVSKCLSLIDKSIKDIVNKFDFIDNDGNIVRYSLLRVVDDESHRGFQIVNIGEDLKILKCFDVRSELCEMRIEERALRLVIEKSVTNDKYLILEMRLEFRIKEDEYHFEIGRCEIETYEDYLETKHWKEASLGIKNIYDNKCCLCGASETELHVHHNNYNNIGREKLTDLIVLCKDCHSKFHDK